MPSDPTECAPPNQNGFHSTLNPTCHLELSSNVIPSIQYQCKNGRATVSSVMVHATDPESRIHAPFKLEPGNKCHDICHYHLGNSGLQVKDIRITDSTIQVGSTQYTPDPFMCAQ